MTIRRSICGEGRSSWLSCATLSERQQSAQALVEEHNLLRTLIDLLPDYIYLKDRDGRYQAVNRAMTRFRALFGR